MATPAKRTQSTPKRKTLVDFEVVSFDEDAEEFVARLFGEHEFRFSTDVNGWLLIKAGSGRSADFVRLIQSLLVVGDGETGDEVMDRFDDAMASQDHLDIERLMKIVNDITEAAAGNDPETSSGG